MRKKLGFTQEVTRVINFLKEFIKADIKFKNITKTITVYGSARLKQDNQYYKIAMELGEALAENGYAVMTGGGPGIMEAVNRGAKNKNGKSYGCCIKIMDEQTHNKYLDKKIHFKYFFTRKIMLTRFSCGFIALPGGFGTLDEIFEIATLIKTKKIKNFPMILIGSDYWTPMLNYLEQYFVPNGTIYSHELKCFTITDDIKHAISVLDSSTEQLDLNVEKS